MIRGFVYLTFFSFFLLTASISSSFASVAKNKKISSQTAMKKLSPLSQKLKAKKFMNESSAYKRLNSKKMKQVIFPEKVELNELKAEDYAKFLPRNLENSQNEAYVANRFADLALQNIFNSPQVRNSSFGQTATKVEKAMKTEVSINGAPKNKTNGAAASSNPGIEHKISLQVLALQAQTKLEYKGWTNATLKHDARAKETGVEISEKVWRNKDLVLSHTKTDIEDKSSVGVRWNW